MNERNQELIVDLIGGRLSQDEESAVLARIESDPVFRAEYETQMSTISLLGSLSTPSMTTEERSTLHAALREQLNLDDSPVPVGAVPTRWQRWLAPLGGLAVAAAVIVGAVVIFPGVLSNSDSDGGVAMVSSEIDTTVPAASFADESAGSADDGGSDAAAPEATENDVAGGSSAEQEIQSATTAAAYDSADTPADLPYLVDVDIDALEDELASDPDFLRNSISTPSTKSSALDTARGDACLDSLRFDDTTSSFTPVATTTYENTEAVVVIVSPADGDPYVAVFDVDPCRELASSKG